MKHLIAIGNFLVLASVAPLSAQTSAPTSAPEPTAAPPVPKHIVFHALTTDNGSVAPIQVGGGSRGQQVDPDFKLSVLVPNQTALTTKAQPSLYWYQSKASVAECEVTLTEPLNPKPLLSVKTSKTTPAGIHAIRLSKFNVELKPNVVYKWSVAAVLDPTARSGDVIATGVIKRVDPSPDLAAKLAAASDADKPAIYAENSIWYDALQSISEQIAHSPNDASLRAERDDLLQQVGFENAPQMEATK
jgi:hypothetical protein